LTDNEDNSRTKRRKPFSKNEDNIIFKHFAHHKDHTKEGLTKKIPNRSYEEMLQHYKENLNPDYAHYKNLSDKDVMKIIRLYDKFGDVEFKKIPKYFEGKSREYLKYSFIEKLDLYRKKYQEDKIDQWKKSDKSVKQIKKLAEKDPKFMKEKEARNKLEKLIILKDDLYRYLSGKNKDLEKIIDLEIKNQKE